MVELTYEVVNEEDDRRRFKRFDTKQRAFYFLKEEGVYWKPCTIINASRKGWGILFRSDEKIAVSSTILLRVFSSLKGESTTVIGMVRWVGKRGNDFVGGIESVEVLDDNNLYYTPPER